MEDSKLWMSSSDIPECLEESGIGEGTESPWTAPRPKFLVTSDANFPQDESLKQQQQQQPGNFHSAPTSPYSTLPPASRGGKAHPLAPSPFDPTATLGLDQQQLEELVGSQWSLRSTMGELRSDSAGSWDNVDMRMPLSYYRALCVERMASDDLNESLSEVEAVMRLLEEKERDLELAARIGQTLLADNRKLKAQVETMEVQVGSSEEKSSQLQHELSTKNELLKVYSRVYESQEDLSSPAVSSPDNDGLGLALNHHGFIGDASSSSSSRGSVNGQISLSGKALVNGESKSNPWPGKVPFAAHVKNIEIMHHKLQTMEEENLKLRADMSHIRTETIDLEDREKELVADAVRQLNDANAHVNKVTEQLEMKTDECMTQQADVTNLLSQVSSQRKTMQKMGLENEDLVLHLANAQDVQANMRSQISELQERYDACCDMLSEARVDVKELEKRVKPRLHAMTSTKGHASGLTSGSETMSSGTPRTDARSRLSSFSQDARSLLQEKQKQLAAMGAQPGWFQGPSAASQDRLLHQKRVLETVKAASRKLRNIEQQRMNSETASEAQNKIEEAGRNKEQVSQIDEQEGEPNYEHSEQKDELHLGFDCSTPIQRCTSPVETTRFAFDAASSRNTLEGLNTKGPSFIGERMSDFFPPQSSVRSPPKSVAVVTNVDVMRTIVSAGPTTRQNIHLASEKDCFDADDDVAVGEASRTRLKRTGHSNLSVTSLTSSTLEALSTRQSIVSSTITRVTSASAASQQQVTTDSSTVITAASSQLPQQRQPLQQQHDQKLENMSEPKLSSTSISADLFLPLKQSDFHKQLPTNANVTNDGLTSAYAAPNSIISALPPIPTFTHNVTTTFSNHFDGRPLISIPTPEELVSDSVKGPLLFQQQQQQQAQRHQQELQQRQQEESLEQVRGADSFGATSRGSVDLSLASVRSWPSTQQSSPLGRQSLPDLVPDQDLSYPLPSSTSFAILSANNSATSPASAISPSDSSSLHLSRRDRLPLRPETPADIAIAILPIAENADKRHIQVNAKSGDIMLSPSRRKIGPGAGGKLVSSSIPPIVLGRPGLPGTSDLDNSLNRLSMRQALLQNRHQQYIAARRRRLTSITTSSDSDVTLTSDNDLESLSSSMLSLSEDEGQAGLGNNARNPAMFPGRLRIVKPMEGSFTLRHWQQLARPQFGGFMESRPGIMPFALQAQRQRIANIRGGGLAGPLLEADDYQVFSDFEDDDLYSLSDLEVDDEDVELHQFMMRNQKRADNSQPLANAKVLHLSDSTGSIPNLAQELGGEYEFLTPTKDFTADQVLKMFVNTLDNLDLPSNDSQPQQQQQQKHQLQHQTASPVESSPEPSRPKGLDIDRSSTTSPRSFSSEAGSGSVTPTMEDRGLAACPSTPPSSPIMPRRRPSTPPNSPTPGRRRHLTPQQQLQQQEKRPSLYSMGYDLLLSACQNSYPWHMSQPPMPSNVEASPPTATATPTITPPPSRFNSLKKKKTPSRRAAEFNKRLSQVSQKGTGGFLDFLENLGLANPWYAGEEVETEAEPGSVIDGHFVPTGGDRDGGGGGSMPPDDSSFNADFSASSAPSAKDSSHVSGSRRSLFAGQDMYADQSFGDVNGGSGSGSVGSAGVGMGGVGCRGDSSRMVGRHSDSRTDHRSLGGGGGGMSGLNEILDVNSEPRRGSGVRLRTNVLKS